MSKLKGNSFQNDITCKGVAYASDTAPHDLAIIEITGRYPQKGWALNQVIHEIAYVCDGAGELLIKHANSIHRTMLSVGGVVSVAPNERFAWEGYMTIIMSCSPSLHPEQYQIEEENDEV